LNRSLGSDRGFRVQPAPKVEQYMALDWSECTAVESVPGRVSGAWVFRGTRIPVSAVFENLEDGLTIDEIAQMFDGLTREQVKSVLDFAAHSLQASTPIR
jgi:uncharacterized protein (DUF433 family)